MKDFKILTFTSLLFLSLGWFTVQDAKSQIPVSPYDFPYGYPFPDYPLAGATHPSVVNDNLGYKRDDPENAIKRIGQYALRLIQTDRAEEAVQYTDWFRSTYPKLLDDEMLFMRSMAQAQLGLIDEAAQSMKQAITKTDIPPQRFIAGPRRMFTPLYNHPDFIELWEGLQDELVHGPMLGVMTDTSVRVWVRTVSETSVRVAVSRSIEMSELVISEPVLSRSGDDYTAVVPVYGLEPDTRYYYQILLGPKKHVIHADYFTFQTYPARDQPAEFQIVFGACAGNVPFNERVWDTIHRFQPRAFLTLGDNVYIDDPESPDQARYLYYQRQSRPEFRRLLGASPVYSIWDDHDFGMNDSEGGPEIDIPYWKPMVLDIFKENWVNPSYGNEERPGVWFDFKIAEVHYIMLDGRYYREGGGRFSEDLVRIPNASMLGPHQLEWLKQTLTESDATFKVLISPVPWKYDAKGTGNSRLDGWGGYKEERDEIFSWIKDYDIEGVVLLSGDRHRSDAWLVERKDDYDLYEFSSGQFTNQHTHNVLEGALFGYNEKPSFGLLSFDTQSEDPTVTYQIVDIDGFIHHSLTLKHSKLRN